VHKDGARCPKEWRWCDECNKVHHIWDPLKQSLKDVCPVMQKRWCHDCGVHHKNGNKDCPVKHFKICTGCNKRHNPEAFCAASAQKVLEKFSVVKPNGTIVVPKTKENTAILKNYDSNYDSIPICGECGAKHINSTIGVEKKCPKYWRMCIECSRPHRKSETCPKKVAKFCGRCGVTHKFGNHSCPKLYCKRCDVYHVKTEGKCPKEVKKEQHKRLKQAKTTETISSGKKKAESGSLWLCPQVTDDKDKYKYGTLDEVENEIEIITVPKKNRQGLSLFSQGQYRREG